MKESDLFAPVKAWLQSHGYDVMAEIPKVFADPGLIDVVGYKDGHYPVIVELKTGFTKKLHYQAQAALLCSPFVYAAAPTMPSREFLSRAWLRNGYGVLLVGAAVEIVRKPRIGGYNSFGGFVYHKRFRQRCAEYVADGVHLDNTVGGTPTLKGSGPAQEVSGRVIAYLAKHPDARWQEIFANVSNHYSNYASMRSALRTRTGLTLASILAMTVEEE